MRLTLNHFCLGKYHDTVRIPSLMMQIYPQQVGMQVNHPAGYIPPQPNSTDNSSQNADNSDTTTVYYEKSTGEHQNKTTSMQTSPRYHRPTGMQMSLPAGTTHEQVGQGQPECNQDKEGQLTNNTSNKGKKSKK